MTHSPLTPTCASFFVLLLGGLVTSFLLTGFYFAFISFSDGEGASGGDRGSCLNLLRANFAIFSSSCAFFWKIRFWFP